MVTTKTDLVTYAGKTYSLADLAHYMECDEREAIHSECDLHETPQGYWDKFCSRYPESAQHLSEIAPRV